MRTKTNFRYVAGFSLLFLLIVACSLPEMAVSSQSTGVDATQNHEIEIRVAIAGTQTALALAAHQINNTAVPSVEAAIQTATITHITNPGEPPGNRESGMTDRDSSSTAPQRAANGGENFDQNLFERPFNANAMDIYYPDLDIKSAYLARSGIWVYIDIEMVGIRPNGGMEGNYGIEIDLDVDGRGDWLILASMPQTAWSTSGVRAWQDTNNAVGNDFPISSDPPQRGNGYDQLYFDQGYNPDPDIAWARISPQNPHVVQLAFKHSLIANDQAFMWGAWTDQGVFNPAFYDYNDHFTHAEAGSPLPGLSKYYPLKALFEVDNTCRWSVGFTMTGDEPGGCPVYVPPTATRIPATPIPTATPTIGLY